MKRFFKLTLVMMAVASLLAACNKSEFKTTDNGLVYKFLESNKSTPQVQDGDVLVGTCTILLDDSVLMKVDQPDRILIASEMYPGDPLPEGLKMMHEGDHAIFGIDADELAKMGTPFPPYYKPGTGMKLYYDITLESIVTVDELAQEEANYNAAMAQIKTRDMELLAKYAQDNGIKAEPNADGLYVVVKKTGKGPKVEMGRTVSVKYTGRLLNGKVFDTNVESVAKANDIDGHDFAPMTYVVGKNRMISGWEAGVLGQPAGTQLTLLMPSDMGYGPREMSSIPANSPLVFDIEIVSVQ